MVHPLECFFGTKCHAALDRNPGQRYNTQILQLTPGDLYSESPNRHFQTLPGLLHSQSALPNSYPDTCSPNTEAVCTIFRMVYGVNRLKHEHMTYYMRGEHANHLVTSMHYKLTTVADQRGECPLCGWFIVCNTSVGSHLRHDS